MSRILTAASTAEPKKSRYLPPQYQDEVRDLVWSCIYELESLGRRRREIAPYERLLMQQTSDPTRYDDPHYGKAMKRWLRYHAELTGIDRRAEGLVANLAKHWDRLHEARKRSIQETLPWFSQQESGELFAAETWRYAKQDEGRDPRWECPFIVMWAFFMASVLVGVVA